MKNDLLKITPESRYFCVSTETFHATEVSALLYKSPQHIFKCNGAILAEGLGTGKTVTSSAWSMQINLLVRMTCIGKIRWIRYRIWPLALPSSFVLSIWLKNGAWKHWNAFQVARSRWCQILLIIGMTILLGCYLGMTFYWATWSLFRCRFYKVATTTILIIWHQWPHISPKLKNTCQSFNAMVVVFMDLKWVSAFWSE